VVNAIVVIFLLTAAATGTNPQFKAGERHAMLAYIRADTQEQAEAELPQKLTEKGWGSWVVSKSALATPDAEKDQGVKVALERGASITVYSDPIPQN
jgi:hypothetical protein